HKGYIDVESKVGRGSSFTLYLPLAGETEVPVQTEVMIHGQIRGGTETILIVEDEEMLILMIKILLEDEGYTVLEAHDGEEAVNIFREKKDAINLIVTDMGLPKLSGYDEFLMLKKIQPDVKVIFASGFFDPNVKAELDKQGAKAYIQKPYDRTELLRVIRASLD
ncbi:MAG: response regulator, partial [Bacteroidetes bacterium]|nr:response regulator [Bacteroidota bacterium]